MKERLLNYIDGKFCEPRSGRFLETSNPATGEVIADVPDSYGEDIAAAVAAAKAALDGWRKLSHQKRAEWLLRIAEGIQARHKELSLAESNNNGKPLALAQTIDIPRSAWNFQFFAGAATQFASESHGNPDNIQYTLREPLGVVGCISPWNLPLYLLTWKIAPALAAGNTVVAKPSEVTPLTAFHLARLLDDIGFPKGVLNIVHGKGPSAGEEIIKHPDIKAVSFTGGTATGTRILQEAAPRFKKLSLELGGKNPALVFDDCDIDEAIKVLTRSAFANQGQICLCNSRFYIQAKIYDKFRDKFVAAVARLKVGDPLSAESDLGALVSKAHLAKVESYLELARKLGGKILVGGKRAPVGGRCQEGAFLEPTVIEGLDSQCPINQEEIFGPVVTLTPFEDEQEAIQLANSTAYGLCATIWTNDLKRAHRISHAVKAGMVWVNTWMERDLRTPFGGTKQSGLGREGGLEAMRFFTEPKNICIQL